MKTLPAVPSPTLPPNCLPAVLFATHTTTKPTTQPAPSAPLTRALRVLGACGTDAPREERISEAGAAAPPPRYREVRVILSQTAERLSWCPPTHQPQTQCPNHNQHIAHTIPPILFTTTQQLSNSSSQSNGNSATAKTQHTKREHPHKSFHSPFWQTPKILPEGGA